MSRRRKKRKHSQSESSTDKNKAPKMKNSKNKVNEHIIEENNEIQRKNKHKKSKKTKVSIWEGIIMLLLLMENGILDELLTTDEYEEIDKNNDYQDFDVFKPNSKMTGSKHTKREATENTVEIPSNEDGSYFDLDYISED